MTKEEITLLTLGGFRLVPFTTEDGDCKVCTAAGTWWILPNGMRACNSQSFEDLRKKVCEST